MPTGITLIVAQSLVHTFGWFNLMSYTFFFIGIKLISIFRLEMSKKLSISLA